MRACKSCKYITYQNDKTCPKCSSSELTDRFSGMIIILDPNHSEIAKIVTLNAPGSYAIKLK